MGYIKIQNVSRVFVNSYYELPCLSQKYKNVILITYLLDKVLEKSCNSVSFYKSVINAGVEGEVL